MFNIITPIHCIGDSHVSVFSGQDIIQPLWPKPSNDILPFFRTYRLGAVLAYSLCSNGTRMMGREKIFTLLQTALPTNATLLLSFGEIDCRAHLLKQAFLQQVPIDQVVHQCFQRYKTLIDEISSMGFTIILWNAIPSTRHDLSKSPEFPTYGTCRERNAVSLLFNQQLKEFSNTRSDNIVYLSIFDHLVDKDGLTNMDYYLDYIHLSQKAMPLILTELNKVARNKLFLPISYYSRYLFKRIFVYFNYFITKFC